MGLHSCEYCQDETDFNEFVTNQRGESGRFGPSSSADVTLTFASGNTWIFPWVGLPHYVTKHRYMPPVEFINDVMTNVLTVGRFMQTKSPAHPVGYLQGSEFPTGDVPDGFIDKLESLVKQIEQQYNMGFRQTRSTSQE